MTYRIALNFEDGATRFIDCQENETILDAAYRHQINLPMDCSDGVCGTCKCRAAQGLYDLGGDYLEEALTAEEAAAGYVLTCQMIAVSDIVLDIPVSSSACRLAPATTQCAVRAVERLSPNRVRLSLAPAPGATLPDFLPGQYVNLAIPGRGVSRSYSFCHAYAPDAATFLIRDVKDGEMGTYLAERAKIGDPIAMEGPFGSFYLRRPTRPILMVAGGTGIAPMLAMLDEMVRTGTGGQPVHLVYGAHETGDLVEVARIEALTERLDGFTALLTCSGPDEDYPVKGRVDEHLGRELLHDGNVDVYLCGPPEMVETAKRVIANADLPVANIFAEKFLPARPAAIAA